MVISHIARQNLWNVLVVVPVVNGVNHSAVRAALHVNANRSMSPPPPLDDDTWSRTFNAPVLLLKMCKPAYIFKPGSIAPTS